ncbi:Hsp20/alpha crystallin family protein [Amphibacillus sediminis]|uniref:Hsp20/alpha crystallin family protein n=1 Tax=Amphibacillus sediminis TaxID=360185 RepID=UPI000830F92B|nr:Hsp20/alpha crystallin family protein [Amphibacillus sediminis]
MPDQYHDLLSLGREWLKKMDHLFQGYPQDSLLASIDQFFQQSRIPTHVHQTDQDWEATFQIPGIKKDRVKVITEQDRLIVRIADDRQQEVKDEQAQTYHYHHFSQERERVVMIPSTVIPSTLTASFEQGLLRVKGRKRVTKQRKLSID